MKKIVTITIEVDMNTKECREWVRPSDYVKCSVFEALDEIKKEAIKNRSGSIHTDSERAKFKVRVQSFTDVEEVKVFKFSVDTLFYAYAAKTKKSALQKFNEDVGEDFTQFEEIPQADWDKKIINVYPDNDTSKKPFKISIREAIAGTDTQLVYTNDSALVD